MKVTATVLGCNGISWTICKRSTHRSRQITTPKPHSILTCRVLFLAFSQQCQSNCFDFRCCMNRAELGPALTSELLRLIDKTPKSFVKNKSVALRYTYLTALIYSSLSVILCSNLCIFILGIGCRCLYRQNSSHAQKAELPSSAESSPVKQWQLLSAVCLERLPQITTPMNSIETRVSAMLLDVENENSSLSDHELRHLDDL